MSDVVIIEFLPFCLLFYHFSSLSLLAAHKYYVMYHILQCKWLFFILHILILYMVDVDVALMNPESVKDANLHNNNNNSNFETFHYIVYHSLDFKINIDANNNIYNNLNLDWRYFTDTQFTGRTHSETGFAIVHFNSRSLSDNFDNFRHYLSKLNFSFDIIAVRETWLNSNSSPELYNLKGYDTCHVDRNNKTRWSSYVYQ